MFVCVYIAFIYITYIPGQFHFSERFCGTLLSTVRQKWFDFSKKEIVRIADLGNSSTFYH